jgi:cytochrome c-type biogenesis protein CcmE
MAMRFRKQQRLMLVVVVLMLVGSAVALALTALRQNIAFFVTPTQIATGEVQGGKRFRLGGLVVAGSVRQGQGHETAFAVTDNARQVDVVFGGLLPDLFREGQGVVAQGALRGDGVFVADEVLAKHDERYMPKEVADALKDSGHWQPDGNGS